MLLTSVKLLKVRVLSENGPEILKFKQGAVSLLVVLASRIGTGLEPVLAANPQPEATEIRVCMCTSPNLNSINPTNKLRLSGVGPGGVRAHHCGTELVPTVDTLALAPGQHESMTRRQTEPGRQDLELARKPLAVALQCSRPCA